MRSAATSFVTGQHLAQPAARIDVQDEPSVLPLREYLEAHGVDVCINKTSGREVTYHIVMGEGRFISMKREGLF